MATKLDLADAQLIGFFHGKSYPTNIIMLVESMGLTKKEWIKLKKLYPIDSYISESEIADIDLFFKERE